MGKTQHTPGPWTIGRSQWAEINGKRELEILAPAGGGGHYIIADVGRSAFDSAPIEANARLIAAAPAQAMIINLLRYDLATVTDGELEFDGIVYAYDDRAPDWQAVMDAIGWDSACSAIAKVGA